MKCTLARLKVIEATLINHFQGIATILSAWQAGLLAWLVSSALAAPMFSRWNWIELTQMRTSDYLLLCEDPLARNLREPILAYRLTLPVIAWLLNLPTLVALALPFVANVLLLVGVFRLIEQRIDKATALLTTIAVSLSWAFFPCNWMPAEFTDTVSHFCAVLMMFNAGPICTIGALLVGLVNDERMLIAVPFVMLWHFPVSFSLEWLRKICLWLLFVSSTIAVYLLYRNALTVGWIGAGISNPDTYKSMEFQLQEVKQPFFGSWAAWMLNIAGAFRWLWLLAPFLILVLIKRSRWLLLAIWTSSLFVATLASFLVWDVGRSVGYVLPAWFVAIAELYAVDRSIFGKVFFRVVLALIVSPVVFFTPSFVPIWHTPLPIVWLRSAFWG